MRSAKGAKVFDVTVPVSSNLPVWPGDPEVVIAPVSRIADGDGVNVSHLSLSSHSGTHVDAPWHVDDTGPKLNEIPLERWIGPCIVIEVPNDAKHIEPQHIKAANIPPGIERLLFKTANSAMWQPGKLDFNESYVAFSPSLAQWIVDHGITLVGIDYLSIDPFADEDIESHHTLLRNDVLVIENLNLSAIAPGAYHLICLPLALVAGDGAPARVLLIQDE